MENISDHVCSCLRIIATKAVAEQLKEFSPIDFYPYVKRGDWVFKKLEEGGYIERVYSNADTQQWQFTYNYLQCLAYNSITVKI